MENTINNGTFIQYLTYFIKMGIYVNKGTDQNALLDRCIKLYNKYKSIEESGAVNEKLSDEDESFIRKCQKRFNLILKVDEMGNPVDIKKKENQLKMLQFKGHPSLGSNDMGSMIEYATKHKIAIIQGVPLTFIMTKSKYQELIWQYMRALFYITQLLISKVSPTSNSDYKVVMMKQRVFDDAADKLESVLTIMSDIEEKIKLDKLMAVDVFLNNTLVKSGIDGKRVNAARSEVKEIFQKKGIDVGGAMGKMIDSISDKLSDMDFTNGNIMQNMMSIARNVSSEIQDDLQGDPEKFQTTIGAITEVFKDAIDNSPEGSNVPPHLRNVLNTVMSLADKKSTDPNYEDPEALKQLESIMQATGMNQDEFYKAIKSDNNEIDPSKLESIMTKIGKIDK